MNASNISFVEVCIEIIPRNENSQVSVTLLTPLMIICAKHMSWRKISDVTNDIY